MDDEADSADVGKYDEVCSFASQFPLDLPEYFSNLNHNLNCCLLVIRIMKTMIIMILNLLGI